MIRNVGVKVFIATTVVALSSGALLLSNQLKLNTNASTNMEEHVSLSMEYEKNEVIEGKVKEHFETNSSNVISITQMDSESAKLYHQYKVETVDSDNEMANLDVQIAEHVYTVDVELTDTSYPIIEGKDVEIKKNDNFNIDTLEIHAYDKVDGDLDFEVKENTVDTSKPGEYKVVVQVSDLNSLKTQKTFKVKVNESDSQNQDGQSDGTTEYTAGNGDNTNYTGYTGEQTTSITTQSQVQALDRNNLYVRGWKIIANDSRVSDATIQAYMNELANLPAAYNTTQFTTVTIDMSLPYPYLGMAYSDGRIWLNGQDYYATTALHEATHTYDYTMGFANDPELVSIFNAEKNNLPLQYSGNMRDDTYEWVANIVVFYYYDPGTLKANAPRSYEYVQNIIF